MKNYSFDNGENSYFDLSPHFACAFFCHYTIVVSPHRYACFFRAITTSISRSVQFDESEILNSSFLEFFMRIYTYIYTNRQYKTYRQQRSIV